MRGEYLWAPVGEPRSKFAPPTSIAPEAARRLDRDELVEIEIDNRLQPCNARPVLPSGKASSHAAYPACKATSSATAVRHRWRRLAACGACGCCAADRAPA
jgi:hypothetical protein